MISLAGLSATYPGYSAEETARTKRDDTQANTASTTIDNQIKARDAAIKMLGANALGAALQGSGPQAPPPGQASVPASKPAPAPMAAIPPPAAPAVPQGGLPPSPQPPPAVSAPPAAGAAPMAGKLGLQPMIAQIIKTSPNVANHPEILLSALNHAKDMGLLDPDAEAAVDGIQKQHTMNRIATAKGHLQAVQGGAGAPAQSPAALAAAPPPTATDPKTGAKVQFIGGQWQPMT
jgi:hypothetical protein